MLRRSIKYTLIASAAFLFLLLAGAIILVNVNFDRFKPELEALVKEQTGRKLVIKGALHPSFSFSPSFEAEEITLKNASWGTQPAMAQAGSVKVVLALMPLLRKELHIETLEIKDASLLLEENDKGKTNWQTFLTPKKKEGKGYKAKVDAVALTNVAIAYFKNGKETAALDIDSLTLVKKNGSQINFGVAGIFNHVPLLLEGKVKNLDRRETEALPLYWVLTAKNSSLVFDGMVEHAARHPTLKGSITGKGLKVEDFIPVPAVGAPPPPPSTGPIFSHEVWPVSGLKNYGADIAVALESLEYGNMAFTNIQSTLTLQKGIVALSPLKALVGEGRLEGKVVFNTVASPPSVDISLNGERLHAETLAKQLGWTQNLTGGGFSFTVETSGVGNSFHTLASSLKGEANLYLEKARYRSKADLGSAEGFFKMLTGKKNRNQTEINCAAAVFDVQQGVAKTRAMVLDTTGALVKGKGNVNFAKETVSLLFTPQAKTLGLADLMVPMRLKGPLRSPKFRQDNQGLLKGLGKAAIGVATGGTATLGFVAIDMVKKLGIQAQGNACLMAMSRKQEEELFPRLLSRLR